MKLVSEEVAKLAKEHGFDITTIHSFYLGEGVYIPRPSRSQLVDWFREEKNILIKIDVENNTGDVWSYELTNILMDELNNLDYYSSDDCAGFKTYDRALNAAIKESFKYLKNEK
tara:strand:+ start:3159 stop:3500 length:342 start_codon:yes stop_codon:yes gene_type:complete